mmetsp:Transcript_39824/g.106294  ORF Transcript_39824/g.106294 Transcript_39824/m.106294 type:complete len:125 (-) Transcript_39824:116-490(-)
MPELKIEWKAHSVQDLRPSILIGFMSCLLFLSAIGKVSEQSPVPRYSSQRTEIQQVLPHSHHLEAHVAITICAGCGMRTHNDSVRDPPPTAEAIMDLHITTRSGGTAPQPASPRRQLRMEHLLS